MAVWRYLAIENPVGGVDGTGARKRTGEISGTSATEVRAALRRVGLNVIALRQLRSDRRVFDGLLGQLQTSIRDSWNRHLRARRRLSRAELYDGVATLLDSGMPLLETIDAFLGSCHRRRAPLRTMLVQVRESLRDGQPLSSSFEQHAGWFDAVEIAQVRAAQHAGTLPQVLRRLGERQQEAGRLTQKLIGALAYPTLLLVVGIGVVIFLSVKTLPELVGILIESGIPAPTLTTRVMSIGSLIAQWWHWIAIALLVAPLLLVGVGRLLRRYEVRLPEWRPRVIRRLAVGNLARQLAELVRTGVPAVDALRILGPTMPTEHLRICLARAADRVERGEELSAAFDDERWFDTEFRRLLDVGQASGELDELLERIGQRYERSAARLIDRLATLLEPAAILVLAVLIGIVVIAAVLPLVRLQEVL